MKDFVYFYYLNKIEKQKKSMEKENLKDRMSVCLRYTGSDTSFRRWRKIRSMPIVIRNLLVVSICKYLPPSKIKNKLYRRIGMKIGKNVTIFGVNFDIFFPELIEIGDNTVIGSYTLIITHEFLNKKWCSGKIKIGKNVLIGAMTMILPGAEIGDNSVVSAYSLVNKKIPSDCMVGGVPVKILKRGTK